MILKWSRRIAAAFAVCATASFAPNAASAQAYPSQDIHLICGFPAGSGADIIVRYVAEKLRGLSGRTIVVENKSGAQGNIATEYVARSKPDGYTIFIGGGSGMAANMSLFKNPPVDVPKAMVAAATLHRQAFMLVVDAKQPWKNVPELTAHLKAKGAGKSTYAMSAAAGAVMGEIYKQATGLDTVQVNYKTAQNSLNDILSGNIDFGMHDPVFSVSQHREGRLRILGVSTGTRLQANPDLPTMAEQGIPMDMTAWWGAMVPAATPKPIVAQLNKWLVEIMQMEDSRKFFNNAGGDPLISTPDEAQALLLKSVKDWGEYVSVAKIPQL